MSLNPLAGEETRSTRVDETCVEAALLYQRLWGLRGRIGPTRPAAESAPLFTALFIKYSAEIHVF